MPLMIAMTMVAVDMTIANVALPHMQASLNASQEQILWVLTSYLLAGAIATPLSGWLATRFGRKLVMVASVGGFTLASVLCGAANDLESMVAARTLQGACGAALIPLSQATLLDINRPEQIAKAMAIFSLGSLAGPIVAPSLGGWLTDTWSWRWVFFINIPFGVFAFFGMLAFMFESRADRPPRFDIFGFLTVSLTLAAIQLMLDRGEYLDWFDSTEIRIYAFVAAIAVYLGIVHMMTAKKETFIRPELYKDRNFTIGSMLSVMIGFALFATIPLIVVMTQTLLGYTAFRTGMIGMPRAIGTMIAMIIVTRLVNRIGTRILLIAGLAINAVGMAMYAQLDLLTDQRALIIAGIAQGIGGGLMFLPLTVLVFSTMPKALRNEGAAMFALTRNIGNAIGISLLQMEFIRYSAASRSYLVEGIRPDNPTFQYINPDFDFSSTQAVTGLSAEITRQASMVGNVEVYWLVVLVTIALMPLVLLMRAGKGDDDKPIPSME